MPIRDASAGGGFPSDNVTLLSHLDLDDFPGAPTRGNDCWGYVSPSGREYALMGLRNALAVVEITSPSDPVIITVIPHTESNWSDVKVYQDHAYVVNEGSGGMDVIDLSQVDSGIVTLVRQVTEGGFQTSHNVAVDTASGFLYLCGPDINGGRLVAFNLSDPANPVLVGQISVDEGADVHDAQIVTYTTGPNAGKQIAFAGVGGTGLDIYDVTDKGNMFRLSRSTYPTLNFHHQCWTEDLQYLYLNDELNGINETVIFDITNLSDPIFSGTYSAGIEAIDHNQYVHQGFIYESDYSAGLRIFDAADPLNPVQVGWFDTYPDSDAAATIGTWSNYPFFPSGNIIISTKNFGMFVVRLGPPPIAYIYPNGLPNRIDPAGDSLLVEITAEDGETLDPASPTLHYDAGAGFVEAPMNSLGGSLYEAVFGPVDCAKLVQFYLSATTDSDITIRDPISAPSLTFSVIAGTAVNVAFDDDMEADLGWTVGAVGDGANFGIWTRVDPNGNGSAPESDHTPDPGITCFVTGQDPPSSNDGDNDVDGGATTLLTPLFDVDGATDVAISYWRWYSNDFFQEDGDEGNAPSLDVFTIDVSNDDGMNWVNVETIGPTGPGTSGGWIQHSFNVADFVTPSAEVRVRFVASDFGNLSVIEAGVDDFQLAIVNCGLVDCNDNGIEDEIDLAECDPGDAACQDCNHNEILDGCEDPIPQQGRIALDAQIYACNSFATITVNDCGLDTDQGVPESVQVLIESDSEPAGELVLLTETGSATGEFQGSIFLRLTDSAGALFVSDGDTVTATYSDDDDGLGGTNVQVTVQAEMDCSPPLVSDVQSLVLGPFDATITFTTDVPAIATLHYGFACFALNLQVEETQFLTSFGFPLTDLADQSTYFFSIEVEDQLGNSIVDDNGGLCYTFETGEVPNYFAEFFSENDNDLDFHTILFTPDGSPDVYAPCIFEILDLPTDPTGGTVLDFDSVDFVAVPLPPESPFTLYGLSYDTLYVGAHGYITLEAGDDEFSPTLAHHFDQPRISVFFELIEPSEGGTVSWKLLADRITVTFEDVPELFQGNSNTFQVDMYFDGRIRFSYLNLDSDDGLVGLSAGTGVLPGFTETDMSALGDCGAQPPETGDLEVVTEVNAPAEISLLALDDGLPNPPGVLTYTILSLPAHGTLSDPGIGEITAVPHALDGSSGLVDYVPDPWYSGDDALQYKVNDGGNPPGGGDSDTSTVSITVGSAQAVHSFDMEVDPGWTTEGQWEFGQPTGGGSHDGDPVSGFTGTNVYGYNLFGDYANNLPPTHLTTTALDCVQFIHTELSFQRWLGVEWFNFDHATISLSTNGLTWSTVWDHDGPAISDDAWVPQTFDISSLADGQPTVFLRWTMGPTGNFVTYPGWNIDDVEIRAVMVSFPGDYDGNGLVDLDDAAFFMGCYTGPGVVLEPGCEQADFDFDTDVDCDDWDQFVEFWSGKGPPPEFALCCVTVPYGDVDGNAELDADDLICMLDGLGGVIACGDFDSLDIFPCETGDGDLNLRDLLNLLDALAGFPGCAAPCR